jgi:hypothetical protein
MRSVRIFGNLNRTETEGNGRGEGALNRTDLISEPKPSIVEDCCSDIVLKSEKHFWNAVKN